MDSFRELIDYINGVYSGGNCSVIPTPSYLKKITGISDKKVLLLFQPVHSRQKSEDLTMVDCTVDNATLDLTGSPLKDDCGIDSLEISANLKDVNEKKAWDTQEEKYGGIIQAEVLKIFNSFSEKVNGENELSIWAICNVEEKSVILQRELIKGWSSRGKIWFSEQVIFEEIDLATVKKSHLAIAGKVEKIETVIKAEFRLKNLDLEHTWINPQDNALMNPLTSDILLRQALPTDSNEFIGAGHWRQLVILDLITKEILKFKEHNDKRIDPVYECGSNTTTIEMLKEEIRRAFTELPMNLTENQITGQNNVSAVFENVEKRDCLSITDKLWNILKFASSYRDLKFALNYIFQCACENIILNTQASDNHLAMLINAISQKELSIPYLVGSEPLELLLEIGLEKARKDYEYVFSMSKICFPEVLQLSAQATLEENQPYSKRLTSRKSLYSNNHSKLSRATVSAKSLLKNPSAQDPSDDTIVGFRNSYFNRAEVDYRLAKLSQVHLILEHLFLMENLKLANLNELITRSFLENTLVPFKDLNPTEHYILNISVPNDQVVNLTKFKKPNLLKITMRSMKKFKQVENTFYYTSEAIIPPQTFPMNAENLSKVDDDIDRDLYFVYRYMKIRTINSNGIISC
ncbi:hypothetical protein DMENIID0001_073510 [Sergentomyia squamirostris]